MLFNCWNGEDSWESLGRQGNPTRRSALRIHWKDWCWSWNSNTLATWCEELTHLKRPWCWERLRAGGEGHDRGWDGWMASPTRWTWVWVYSGSWWGKGGLACYGSWKRRVRYDWPTELNWADETRSYFLWKLSSKLQNQDHVPFWCHGELLPKIFMLGLPIHPLCQALTISSLVESWHTILTSNLGQRSCLIRSSTVSMYHRAQGTGSS